ncbi:1-pyrroline-5-carboxylate dehydrogenase [Modicella reniformis]|uniref:L-glutamate gamma-semialdehyde dehydrogenase n=1 Tax=Modicella reniformis TaxID=1440133 RepID=A0A9P6MFN8_9FUNG|nr:1-pyrroline-5-carboxylate dehydrogenase [Modicella reniformis]
MTCPTVNPPTVTTIYPSLLPATLATFEVPAVANEPMKSYSVGSAERAGLQAALKELRAQAPLDIPCIVNGKEVSIFEKQVMPHEHEALVAKAIDGALTAKNDWEITPFNDRAAIFLILSPPSTGAILIDITVIQDHGCYHMQERKNAWQAEIDAAAELADFWRFGVKFAEELYAIQPPQNAVSTWNRIEYRPLEGFVFAVTPFNFTAIAGNLAGAPVLVGNVCVWKLAPATTYASYVVYQILKEAGLPDGVIQFIPGPPAEVVGQVLKHPDFAALHFTGSTHVFRKLWKDIGNNIENYKSYPRIVGETGGKNFHMVHKSAIVKSVVLNTVRSAFEYQGQKCSACSRAYFPDNLWPEIKKDLVENHALTGALFSQDRYATILGANKFRHAAGNFYINDKCTGAVVGGRASGTNGKAGSAAILSRFVSPRSIKETFVDLDDFIYPSNLV